MVFASVSLHVMGLVMGVDVGIVHLALVSVAITTDHRISDIRDSRIIDVTKMRCVRDCKLHHSNNIVDRMNHVFAQYGELFDAADEIFIEAQPLVGLVHVEALILSRYRSKAHLVQPVAVQTHFKWPKNNYEGKKQAAVITAMPHMPALSDVQRKHDLADAFCLVLFVCQKRARALSEAEWKAARRGLGSECAGNPFSSFAFARTSKDVDRDLQRQEQSAAGEAQLGPTRELLQAHSP